MLAATLLLMLHVTPEVERGFLAERTPRRIRLVALEADPGPTADYRSWTRLELRAEYDRLESLRPGVGLPVSLLSIGLGTAALSGLSLASAASSFFGVAVYVAIALTVAIVIGLGIAIIGVVLLARNAPERRALGQQMDEIEAVYRDRRCDRGAPCETEPRGAPSDRDPSPLPLPVPAEIPPQVMAPTLPIFVAAF